MGEFFRSFASIALIIAEITYNCLDEDPRFEYQGHHAAPIQSGAGFRDFRQAFGRAYRSPVGFRISSPLQRIVFIAFPPTTRQRQKDKWSAGDPALLLSLITPD